MLLPVQLLADCPSGMVWVYINDPGVSGHESFTGYMSKYETTNAQYCEFLNAALASGDIYISGTTVYGANGSNPGADFVDQVYYNLAGLGSTYNGAPNGGAARINWTGSSFTVDSGFENHPVTYVSWYGSTAFAGYYGWRLPTEWEWQAVADYDGSYTHGCGTSINNNIANYYNSTHPYGTTVVGSFGTYGYGMCDMAGNVWELTSTVSGSPRVIRGGSWCTFDHYCTISSRSSISPYSSTDDLCFRVVMESEEPEPGFFVTTKNLSIDNAFSTCNGFFTDFYFFSSLNLIPMNTLDEFRSEVPYHREWGDSMNYIFGNTVETDMGWNDLSEDGLTLEGHKLKGQWSRLGQVIDPSVGFLVEEADYGTRQWRWRQLVTQSSSIFQYNCNDIQKTEENFNVSLRYTWRCYGLAKDDQIAWLINHANLLVDIVGSGITGTVDTATEIATVLLCWDIMADNFELYDVGVSLLPEDSSLKAWTYAIVTFNDGDGNQLGYLDTVWGGWPGQDPMKCGSYETGSQISQSELKTLTLPVDEPITAKIDLCSRAEAKGAAESYAGILSYELKIEGPPGTEPLILSGTDPSPDDIGLARSLSSSLLQATETEAFIIGAVSNKEFFADSNSVNETGVVVLSIDSNSPVSGVFVPVYLVPQMKTIEAHVDGYWTDGSDLSNTCVEFMLVDDSNNLLVDGGIASNLFGAGMPISPVNDMDRHSGTYALELDVSSLPSGNYTLAFVYGEPNYSEPNSCLVVQGFSVDIDANIRKSILGDFNLDDTVDLLDLKKLLEAWLAPVPISEKDLYPDGTIDFKDFAVFAKNWLKHRIFADINLDGNVNLIDFGILAHQWHQPPHFPSADIAPDDGDGLVNYLDLAEIAEHWLEDTIP